MQQIIIDDLEIDVLRKRIKNMYLRIHATTGRVQISAPIKMREQFLYEFIQSKIAWIKSSINKLSQMPKPVTLQYVSGEQHYFLGKQHTLNVIEGAGGMQRVVLHDGVLNLFVRRNASMMTRRKILLTWYQNELMNVVTPMIHRYQPIMRVHVSDCQIKLMKTKWGVCHTRDKRICLNLELAKKAPHCIEHVVVHEMVHLLERGHNKRFYGFMDLYLPRWREYKKELNFIGL